MAAASSHPWSRRLVAVLGLLALLFASRTAAVRASREPLSRGDVMRIIYTNDVPDEIEPIARVVQSAPGQVELATPRAPTEPKTVLTTAAPKGVLLGGGRRRGRLGRRRRRFRVSYWTLKVRLSTGLPSSATSSL